MRIIRFDCRDRAALLKDGVIKTPCQRHAIIVFRKQNSKPLMALTHGIIHEMGNLLSCLGIEDKDIVAEIGNQGMTRETQHGYTKLLTFLSGKKGGFVGNIANNHRYVLLFY